MNSFLLFLVKSTLILSLLYLAFSVLMRRETFFQLNRMVLLVMVLSSLLIPWLYLPQPMKPIVQVNLEPIFQSNSIVTEPVPVTEIPLVIQSAVPASEKIHPKMISLQTILFFVYLSGILVTFLMFVFSIGSVLLLFRKARKTEMNGIRIMIVTNEIPAFSFGRNILISQHDYDTDSEAIIIHEQSHIRLGHFYDLMLMELVKIIFWFNPLVYRMVSDLKEIHEFQADDHTLNSGIDATQYQLLIIQKCVGHQKFALANSFNHCQIKNRITMMNKQKTSKAWRWKVATFLPLLALLMMAFGKKGQSANPKQNLLSSTNLSASQNYDLQSSEASFNSSEKKNTEVTNHSIMGKAMIGETIHKNETEINKINSTDLPRKKNIDPNNDIKSEETSSTNNNFSTEINTEKKEDLRVISGKVINSVDGEPLAGISVLIKGKTMGTITDVNGKFTIKSEDTNPSLVFALDGFEKSEIEAKEKNGITVKLAPGKNYESVLLNKKNKMETWAKILKNIPKFPEGQEPIVIQDGYETMYPANHVADMYNSDILRDVKYSPTTNLNLKQTDKAKHGVLLINTTIPRRNSKYLYVVDGEDVYLNDQFIDVYVFPNKIKKLVSNPPKEAVGKYGRKGKFGATEIITDKE